MIHRLNKRPLLTFFSASAIVIVSIIFLSFNESSVGSLERDVLSQTNQFRKSKGLSSLELRDDLSAIAQQHSEDMARGRVGFGHTGFNKREKQASKTLTGMSRFAENVAYGASTGKEAVDMWKKSSGHRKNMLGKFRYIGIGTARNKKGMIYYTQIFAY